MVIASFSYYSGTFISPSVHWLFKNLGTSEWGRNSTANEKTVRIKWEPTTTVGRTTPRLWYTVIVLRFKWRSPHFVTVPPCTSLARGSSSYTSNRSSAGKKRSETRDSWSCCWLSLKYHCCLVVTGCDALLEGAYHSLANFHWGNFSGRDLHWIGAHSLVTTTLFSLLHCQGGGGGWSTHSL